jgi:plastocyanin
VPGLAEIGGAMTFLKTQIDEIEIHSHFNPPPGHRPGTADRKGRFLAALVSVVLALAPGLSIADDEVHLVIKDHQFSPAEVRVKANTKIKLIVRNDDPTAEEFESFSLNREKVVRPGQSITIYISPLKPGSYEFFGDFHPDSAQGKVIAE